MRLLKSPPPNRSADQLHCHYLVERSIADRLRQASREERQRIYPTMYDELFRKVPDHPRLTRRDDTHLTQLANRSKLALVREFLKPGSTVVEFAPGDCRFALEVAHYVKRVYAIDISAQLGSGVALPENFSLILYDGYQLQGIQRNSVDLVFSDQFIEHLHPDDTRAHFELAYQILKPGGEYVFRTPHAFDGPHDVSQYFSDEPQGFHLKEWTFGEFKRLLSELNFGEFYVIWRAKGIQLKLPYRFPQGCERLLSSLPRRYTRAVARYLFPSICIVAVK